MEENTKAIKTATTENNQDMTQSTELLCFRTFKCVCLPLWWQSEDLLIYNMRSYYRVSRDKPNNTMTGNTKRLRHFSAHLRFA